VRAAERPKKATQTQHLPKQQALEVPARPEVIQLFFSWIGDFLRLGWLGRKILQTLKDNPPNQKLDAWTVWYLKQETP
jgi:hypothetical protein